jgi:hypothetical protein
MDLLELTKLSAVVALGYGPSLLLDLEERPVVVLTGRRAMTFDARFAVISSQQQ